MAARQIQPSGNPFAVGAVVFDSTPYTQYFLRQEAEAQAKDEALGKHFEELQKSLTPTGMRKQDVSGLLERKAKLREYWSANRDKIKNTSLDGGKAYLEYTRMIDDGIGEIQLSKSEGERENRIIKMTLDPKIKELLDEDDFALMDEMAKPIQDPSRKVVNEKDFTFSGKELSPKEQADLFKSYTSGLQQSELGVIRTPSADDKFKDEVRTDIGFNRLSLQTIGQNAARAYQNSKDVKRTFKKAEATPEKLEAFRYAYGPDAQIETPAQLHAAEAILANMGKQVKIDYVENTERRDAAREAARKRAADDAYIRAQSLVRLRASVKGSEEGDDDDYLDAATEAALSGDDELKSVLELGKNTDDSIVDIKVTGNGYNFGNITGQPLTQRKVVITRETDKLQPWEETFIIPMNMGKEAIKKEVSRIANNVKVISPVTQRKNAIKQLPKNKPKSGRQVVPANEF